MKSRAILIFDPEEAVRESLRLVLNEEGYKCFSVTDEINALNILNKQTVNLAILDYEVLGSTDLLQEIKQQYPQTKIIIISSYSEVDGTQKALSHGADGFVLEPLDFDELITQINKLLLPMTG